MPLKFKIWRFPNQHHARLFDVRSDEQHQVWLGSETHLPTCQYTDYRSKKLLCKHMCAVFWQAGVEWESLSSRFNTHPLFILDQEVIHFLTLPYSADDLSKQATPSISKPKMDEMERLSKSSVEVKPSPSASVLPCKKNQILEGNAFKKLSLIQEVESLFDELYNITDKHVLIENTIQKKRISP